MEEADRSASSNQLLDSDPHKLEHPLHSLHPSPSPPLSLSPSVSPVKRAFNQGGLRQALKRASDVACYVSNEEELHVPLPWPVHLSTARPTACPTAFPTACSSCEDGGS